MKIKFIPLALMLGLISGFSQITTTGNALFYVSPNTGVYSTNNITVNETSKVVNAGNIRISAGTVQNNAAAENFELKYADEKNYGQLIIASGSNASGSILMPRTLITTRAMGNVYFGSPFDGYTLDQLGIAMGIANPATSLPINTGVWREISFKKWNNAPDALRYDPPQSRTFEAGTLYSLTKQPFIDAGGAEKFYDLAGVSFQGTPHVAPVSSTLIPFQKRTVKIGDGALNAYYIRYSSYLNDPFANVTFTRTSTEEELTTAGYASNILYVANPFTSNIDVSQLIQVSGLGNVIQGIGYFGAVTTPGTNMGHGGTDAQLITIKATGYSTVTGKFTLGDFDKVQYIPPMRYFFVKINKDATGHSLSLDDTRIQTFTQTLFDASTGTTPYPLMSRAVNNNHVYQVNLRLSDAEKEGNVYSQTYVAANNSSETGVVNEYEAVFTNEDKSSAFRIYTLPELPTGGIDPAEENTALYINTLNLESGKVAIPVVVETNSNTEKDLVITSRLSDTGVFLKKEEGNFKNPNAKFYFHDKELNIIKLIDTNFNYPVKVSGTVKDRFEIFWKDSGLTTIDDKKEEDMLALDYSTSIYKSGDDYKVRFNRNWKSADVTIFSSLGQLISSAHNVDTQNDYVLPISKASSTMYIIKIIGDNGEIITKKTIK